MTKIMLVIVMFFLSACFGGPPDKNSAMQRAVFKVPKKVDMNNYSHFLFEGSGEDKRRLLTNFNRVINKSQIEAISIECAVVELCDFIFFHDRTVLPSGLFVLLPVAIENRYSPIFVSKGARVIGY